MDWSWNKDDSAEGYMRRLYAEALDDPDLMKPGCRNEDGVNLSIILECLGIDLDSFQEECKANIDNDDCLAVFNRVEPYLDYWCYAVNEYGKEYIDFYKAYQFMIN